VSSVVILGILILAGLVVNNGIVLIDHANGLRGEGMPLREAIVTGSSNRLRPILITTVSNLLAVLPLMLGIGRGDELAQPLGMVTFGGLFLSTTLTLYVIPVLYKKLEEWRQARTAAR
jgi:HAE1 family hydrophobic/amphiphilic exporter-1